MEGEDKKILSQGERERVAKAIIKECPADKIRKQRVNGVDSRP